MALEVADCRNWLEVGGKLYPKEKSREIAAFCLQMLANTGQAFTLRFLFAATKILIVHTSDAQELLVSKLREGESLAKCQEIRATSRQSICFCEVGRSERDIYFVNLATTLSSQLNFNSG